MIYIGEERGDVVVAVGLVDKRIELAEHVRLGDGAIDVADGDFGVCLP